MLGLTLWLLAQSAAPNFSDTSLGVVRGGDVINRCSETSPESASFCFGYIAGVFDSVRAYETWLHVREFCIPAGTPQNELRDVIVSHLQSNPNDRIAQGASVVVRALKLRFPCDGTPSTPVAPAPSGKP
jgi:hypothetical protein